LLVAKRDSFLLRIDPQVMHEIRRMAEDELRSVNGQIEFLLRDALRRAGRDPGDRRPNDLHQRSDVDED
jgi:hypothetical protein